MLMYLILTAQVRHFVTRFEEHLLPSIPSLCHHVTPCEASITSLVNSIPG